MMNFSKKPHLPRLTILANYSDDRYHGLKFNTLFRITGVGLVSTPYSTATSL